MRRVHALGTAYAAAAGAGATPVPTRDMPRSGIVALVLAIAGAGNTLAALDRVRVKVGGKMKVDLPVGHLMSIIQRWSDSSLVPAGADTRITIPLNVGPAGRLDDRFQLAPGETSFELVTLAAWAVGTFRLYVVTTDEPALGYVEMLNDALNMALGTGPVDHSSALDGILHGFVINTTGLAELRVEGAREERMLLDTGAPSPLLELERLEDGAALAGLDPRAYLLRGGEAASACKFRVTTGAAWAGVANSLTRIRHIPLAG